jgi:hypothetical protein
MVAMRGHFVRALIAILFLSFVGVGACVVRTHGHGHRRHHVTQKHKHGKKHKHAKHKKHKKHRKHH